MKIQRILTISGNLYVLGVIAEQLHGIRKIERHFRLVRADKHEHLERVLGYEFQVLGVDVLEIDQDIICGHGGLPLPVRRSQFYRISLASRTCYRVAWKYCTISTIASVSNLQ
jgi:hypothetical protein